MSRAQARAHRDLMPEFGIAYRPAPLEFVEQFGRRAPVILEIGCGMGETTVAMAEANADHDYIGIEVHTPGVGALLTLIEARQIGNVRVIQHDAVEVLGDMIPRDSLAGVHIFFPDPWPKKRHHKRRLVKPSFISLVASRLIPGGVLHLATDWQDYAEEMLAVASAEVQLENVAAGFVQRPESRPMTKFEARGLRLGHRVWDLMFRRRAGASAVSPESAAATR